MTHSRTWSARLVVATVIFVGLFSVAPRALALPHPVEGYVGLPDATGLNQSNFITVELFLLEDAAAPSLTATVTPSDGVDPARFDWDAGSDWPNFEGNTVVAVAETVQGVNGWVGANSTTSTDGVMTGASFDTLPDTDLELLPTPTTAAGTDNVVTNWTGLLDVHGNVAGYTVYDGAGAVVGTASQIAGGAISFNDTGLTPGTYCYRLAVNYRVNTVGGSFEGLARSASSCATVSPGPSAPQVLTTSPANGAPGVALGATVSATFSEAMATGGVTLQTSPTSTFNPLSWTGGTQFSTTPNPSFVDCVTYTAWINGTDVGGTPLASGPVPNPWTFTTLCILPQVVTTTPANNAVGVAGTQDIVVTFSEAMDNASVTIETSPPITVTPAWGAGNDDVTGTHASFTDCVRYTVWVNGSDVDGNALVAGPVPNPWSFTATCTLPFIVSTDPFHTEAGVLVTRSIIITFSEEMQTSTCGYALVPNFAYTPSWNLPTNTIVTLTPNAPLLPGTTYTVNVSCQDIPGNSLISGPAENPFNFTTVTPTRPAVTITAPAAGVSLSGGSSTSVTWSLADNNPVGLLTVYVNYTSSAQSGSVVAPTTGYTASNTQAWTVPCVNATDVQVNVTAVDADGEQGSALSGAVEIDCTAPSVMSSIPADAATGVLATLVVQVTFSEGMDQASVTGALFISPTVTGMALSFSADNRTVLVAHNPFTSGTNYTVTVATAAHDDSVPGNPLAGEHTFTFSTEAPILTPSPPSGLAAPTVNVRSAELTWVAPTTYTNSQPIPGSAGITYTLYRADTETGLGAEVGTTTTLSFVDAGVQPGKTYYYSVTATVGGQSSARSAPFSVTTPQESSDITMWIVLGAIIVAAVLGLLFFLMRRKKPTEEQPPPPSEETPPPPEGEAGAPGPSPEKPAEGEPEAPPKEPEEGGDAPSDAPPEGTKLNSPPVDNGEGSGKGMNTR